LRSDNFAHPLGGTTIEARRIPILGRDG